MTGRASLMLCATFKAHSPIPSEILTRQGLCAVSCEDAPLYRDSLIWKGHLSSQAAAFADEVRKVIHQLME